MPLYHMKEIINKLNNIIDSAISILEPNFEYSKGVIVEERYSALHLEEPTFITSSNEDFFREIYGHEDIKSIINLAIRSEKPVHVLLTSSPGMAKTQFLLAIRNMFKDESCLVIGSATKKGIVDLLFEKRLQIVLIDELETMGYDTQESLLNLMP
jgi:Holliday junction resolvasome RuvABC ATP-dependent DNA helicase subunit